MLRKHVRYAIIITSFIVACNKDNGTTQRIPDPSYNVNAITDVQYGINTNTYLGDDEKLSFDIYSPKDASASRKYPLIVMAHGGSFIDGDKENIAPLCQAIAEKGYITVSINYRLGWDYGKAQSPANCKGDTVSLQNAVYRALQDYHASLRFLVHNANKYFIDTNWIFAGGSSAGAVAAVNLIYATPEFVNAYFQDEKAKLGALRTADNNLTDAVNIKGDINLWGALVSDELITPATAVPMVAFHGSADETIPIDSGNYALCPSYPVLYGSQAMYNKLTALGVPAVLHIAQGEGHGPDIYTRPDFVSTNVNCFVQSLIGKTQTSAIYNNQVTECR